MDVEKLFDKLNPDLNVLSSPDLFSKLLNQPGKTQSNVALQSQIQLLIQEITSLQEERKNNLMKMKALSMDDDISSSLIKMSSTSENFHKEQELLFEKSLEKYSSFPSVFSFISNRINALLLQLKVSCLFGDNLLL